MHFRVIVLKLNFTGAPHFNKKVWQCIVRIKILGVRMYHMKFEISKVRKRKRCSLLSRALY